MLSFVVWLVLMLRDLWGLRCLAGLSLCDVLLLSGVTDAHVLLAWLLLCLVFCLCVACAGRIGGIHAVGIVTGPWRGCFIR